jgi:endonuclease G, mitochondrial
MALLSLRERIELIRAADSIGAGEPDSRRILVARLGDRRATMQIISVPHQQVVADLTMLENDPPQAGEIPPLVTWLENAIVFAAGQPAEAIFWKYLDKLSPGAPGAPGAPDPASLPEYKEAIVFQDDMVPYSYLRLGLAAGQSVARLLTPRYDGKKSSKKGYWGTGWLVSPTRLMTNHHVLNARDRGEKAASPEDFRLQALATVIQFDYESDESATTPVPVVALHEFDEALDFAILEIAPQPDRPALSISAEPLTIAKKDYVPLNIIQHPRGLGKKIAIRNNLATSSNLTDLRYFTDTLPGSSGSPVFNDDWKVVALHRGSTTASGVKFQGRTTAVLNVGTPIHRILEKIQV